MPIQIEFDDGKDSTIGLLFIDLFIFWNVVSHSLHLSEFFKQNHNNFLI